VFFDRPVSITELILGVTKTLTNASFAAARLEAELLVGHALNLSRVQLVTLGRETASAIQLEAVRTLIDRRLRHEPIAYIIEKKEFWGRELSVSHAVLIPRPETELLVQKALARIDALGATRILDVCTGSGAIGLTIGLERPKIVVHASDISATALEVAKANARLYTVSNVLFFESDLFEKMNAGQDDDPRYDVIVSNPPYIRTEDLRTLDPQIVLHEPHLALDGGDDGLVTIGRLLLESPRFLRAGGYLLMEVGAGQAEAIACYLERLPMWQVIVLHEDWNGYQRIVELKLKQPDTDLYG